MSLVDGDKGKIGFSCSAHILNTYAGQLFLFDEQILKQDMNNFFVSLFFVHLKIQYVSYHDGLLKQDKGNFFLVTKNNETFNYSVCNFPQSTSKYSDFINEINYSFKLLHNLFLFENLSILKYL